jgi:osomolarity two-component system, sensor histidine kinase SLN1
VTGDGLQDLIPLPMQYPNGSTVYFGDPGPGFPPSLYPNLTYTSERINSTYNKSNAFYEGLPLYSDSTLFLGPYQVNDSFAMMSLTVAINNNTSM